MIREGIKEGIKDVAAPCDQVHTRSSRCRYNYSLPLTTLVRGCHRGLVNRC